MIADFVVRFLGLAGLVGMATIITLMWLNHRHYADYEQSYEIDYARLRLLREHARRHLHHAGLVTLADLRGPEAQQYRAEISEYRAARHEIAKAA